ncbi:MAG: c-type cytochrome [Opitutaceae bacterium]|nr:c-type cytochrome [Opitutaceae bacterium]
MNPKYFLTLFMSAALLSAAEPSRMKGIQMLVPGFTIRELPVQLTSINNLEYAPDGRLFAGGYDGRFHVLRDTDGDGLEDKVDTFSSKPSPDYPLGVAVKNGEPYFVLTSEVIRFRDLDGDGVPETREVFASGFDLPELAKAPWLLHRRVDNAMAVAFGPDGALYLTMGNAGYSNAYWKDKEGTNHYSPDKRRGCLLRITPDGKVEQLASGLRYIMSLQWNRHGDLFGSDQEGATWVPNGNPLDELLHLQAGRHYGFPPRHPVHLPNVIDEPSVWDYAPQHQSTCGFRFNGPTPGRGRFGPDFWGDDAIVTGESRGKLWRTKLAKTAAGYVARTDLIANLGLLAVDCAISPTGDLVVCCHTGAPDWGNGPTGEGRIFKISFSDRSAPQPVLTWPASETETVIAFDRPLAAAAWAEAAAHTKIDSGRYVSAADRLEAIRPGYAVVKAQQNEPRGAVAVKSARLSADRRNVTLTTAPRASAVNYAIALPEELDVAHDLSGLAADWRDARGVAWSGWLPHADFTAARDFTRVSAMHDDLWKKSVTAGTLTLRTQLDLWQMLQPATQPGAQLDYTPEPETVTVVFLSDATLAVTAPGATLLRVSDRETHVTVAAVSEEKWLPLTLTVTTPARTLDVSYHTTRDPRPRALGTRRFLVPFAKPGAHDLAPREIAEIVGGNWPAGRALFNGKAACATCHQLRGDGKRVGPELGNLVHRDYASVLRDIAEPNAAINPDGVGYVITMKDGSTTVGTRLGESAYELQIGQVGGAVAKLKKSDIARTEPMTVSLMPPGLEKSLNATELRDLMTFLLTTPTESSKP